MKKTSKHHYLLVAFGVALYALLMNLEAFGGALRYLGSMILPVLLGFLIAFIINVPMRGFEKLLEKLTVRIKRPKLEKYVPPIALLLTAICIILVIVLVCTILIPSLVTSVESLYRTIEDQAPKWIAWLQEYHIDTEWLVETIEKIDLDSLDLNGIIGNVTSSAGSILTSALNIATSAVSVISAAAIGIIISAYALLSKKDLSRQTKKLLYAHLKPKMASYLCYIGRLTGDTFSKFLSGQCLEACLLGTLICIAMMIFKIPYASLIGILTAICAFIPYIGALLSCVIGAFLVVLTDPSKVIVCIIVYLVVQFVESQFIYPHVVGTSVGLDPLWTLIAVLVGGNLMGLFGMIFFIPLTAVIFQLVREHTNRVLEEKQLQEADVWVGEESDKE
ncbi:MAG: AI-2E family transporter [Ruminococcaceae bacterium]|nr:AI-2E family transporter [Oscillospiraceae bacterium]